MTVKLLTEHHLEFLSLKGGCTGSSESTLVKMPHCWKSRVMAHFCSYLYISVTETPHNLFTTRTSNFTPRSSLAPSRVKVEKSLFGLGGNQSPACHTPVRTPVRKEILPYSVRKAMPAHLCYSEQFLYYTPPQSNFYPARPGVIVISNCKYL